MGSSTRAGRVESRERDARWRPAPLAIDMSICINCDACVRSCPPQFGAIINHGIDVIVLPELCSGCGKCIDPCPVDCIHEDPTWRRSPQAWWDALAIDDPY